jgi:hypothetical protein
MRPAPVPSLLLLSAILPALACAPLPAPTQPPVAAAQSPMTSRPPAPPVSAESAGAKAPPPVDGDVKGERILPLGPADVSDLHGAAYVHKDSARRPLQPGAHVAAGERIETAATPGSGVELRFADGSLLRLGAATAVTLLSDARQVALHRGRLLVAADRMLGSISVLTRRLWFVPEGTTYVLDLVEPSGDASVGSRLELTVLEGAVCACPVAASEAGAASAQPALKTVAPKRDQIVLPGERLVVSGPGWSVPAPQPESLTARMNEEPLISGFSRRLPTWLRIDELADQQRRHFLAGRNERLRREIFWKRPPRPAIKLPALFSEPRSVTVRYE